MKNFTLVLIDDDADDRQIFEYALNDVNKNITFHSFKNIQGLQSLPSDTIRRLDLIFLVLKLIEVLEKYVC